MPFMNYGGNLADLGQGWSSDPNLMMAAKRNNSPPIDRRSAELQMLPRYGIPESQPQPDANTPAGNYWYEDYVNRTGRTPYHFSPDNMNPVFPWTQISPKIDSHSNMPSADSDFLYKRALGSYGQASQMDVNFPTAYDEQGNRYPGLSPAEARIYNKGLNQPPSPQPSTANEIPQWILDAIRG